VTTHAADDVFERFLLSTLLYPIKRMQVPQNIPQSKEKRPTLLPRSRNCHCAGCFGCISYTQIRNSSHFIEQAYALLSLLRFTKFGVLAPQYWEILVRIWGIGRRFHARRGCSCIGTGAILIGTGLRGDNGVGGIRSGMAAHTNTDTLTHMTKAW